MYVYDLLKSMEYVRDEIGKKNILKKYQTFCQQLRQTHIDNQPVDIEPSLNDLLSTINTLDFSSFTSGMENILKQYDFFMLVGSEAVEQISSIKNSSSFNPQKAVTDIDSMRDKLSELIQTANGYLGLLNNLNLEKEYDLEENQTVMQISFSDVMPIDNVKELALWIKDYQIIFDKYGSLNGCSAGDIKFQSINKSSPLIFDVIVYNWLARSIGKTINIFLEGYEKYLNIRIKQHQANELDTNRSNEIAELHRLDAEDCKDGIIEQAASTILEDARNSGYEETPEWNTLSYAVKRLFKFFDMGGQYENLLSKKSTGY